MIRSSSEEDVNELIANLDNVSPMSLAVMVALPLVRFDLCQVVMIIGAGGLVGIWIKVTMKFQVT